MFMVGCSLRAVVMQFLTYFRLAGHLIFLPFASALHATVACFTEIFSISAGREFDSLCDAITHELPARWPPDLLLLGLRLARSGRLF